MSANFLVQFMRAAMNITGAERCMAVDSDLSILELVNKTNGNNNEFMDLARPCLIASMESGEAVITNNIITDPSEAPVTNTNFSDLRVMVAIPVVDMGAIYLDQHIRRGVIPRETIEKLGQLAVMALEQQVVDDAQKLVDLYNSL